MAKRYLLTLLLVVLLGGQSLAQSTTARLAAREERGRLFEKATQYAQAIATYRGGLQAARRAGIDSIETTFLFRLGNAYYLNRQYDSAQHYLRLADQCLTAAPHSNARLRPKILMAFFAVFERLANADSMEHYGRRLEKELLCWRTTSREYAEINRSLGYYYVHKKAYEMATTALLNALPSHSARADTFGVAATQLGLGSLFSQTENFDKSAYYTRLAIQGFTQLGDTRNVALAYQNLANGYFLRVGQTDSMGHYLHLSRGLLARVYQQPAPISNPTAYHRAFPITGQPAADSSSAFLPSPRQMAEAARLGNYDSLQKMYHMHGEYYQARGEFDKALGYLRKSLDIVKDNRMGDNVLISSYGVMAEFYEAQGNWQKVLEYERLATAVRDSAVRTEITRAVNETEVKFQTQRRQQQIALLDALNRAQTLQLDGQRRTLTLLVLSGLLGCVLAGVSYRRYYYKKRFELEQVRSRIAADFHDELGANLSSIALYSDILQRATPTADEKARHITGQIADNARQTLTAVNDLIWTIKPDNDTLALTFVRMKTFAIPLLEARGLAFAFDFDESLASQSFEMEVRKNIYLIFKEAINNALKYAQASTLTVQMVRQGREARLVVADDGRGFEPGTVSEGNGLGNLRQRAANVRGRLSIASAPGQGTRLTLDLPLG